MAARASFDADTDGFARVDMVGEVVEVVARAACGGMKRTGAFGKAVLCTCRSSESGRDRAKF